MMYPGFPDSLVPVVTVILVVIYCFEGMVMVDVVVVRVALDILYWLASYV